MITHLALKQFRNHAALNLDFNSNLVAITGPNASGKTNILEALYISSLTKSFKNTDNKLVMHGGNFFTIDKVDNNTNVHIRFTQTDLSRAKALKVNKVAKPLYSIIGQSPITLFEPNDLYLLTGLPSLRRNYLDKILSQVDKVYLQNLRQYKKIVHHRNSLLKRAKKENVGNINEQLFVLNIQLAKPGYYLTKKRQEFISSLAKSLNNYYQLISGESAKIVVEFNESASSSQDLLNKIEDAVQKDRVCGFSTVGPHKEDFSVSLRGHNLTDSASRGELRSLVLACKLSELDYIEKKLSRRPTLLLDDVLSELDDARQKFLLSSLSMQQTFLTTTHLPDNLKLNFQHIELPL